MPNLGSRGVAIVAAAVLLTECSSPEQPKTSPAAVIEPQPSLDAGTGCTVQLGIARVNALFAAMNRGDANAAAAMFPHEGEGLVMQPMFEFDELNQKASTPDQVAAVVQGLSGIHLVFTAPLQGKAQRFDYYPEANQKVSVWSVVIGPVLWKATWRGRSYQGGGKITFNCESGKFLEVRF